MNMKKFGYRRLLMTILLTGLLAGLSLFGCAGTIKPEESSRQTESTEPAKTSTEETEPSSETEEEVMESEEQVLKLLQEANEAGKDELQFTCSEDMYDFLSADVFAELRILLVKSGAEAQIHYSDTAHLIALRTLTFTDNAWAECKDEKEVKEALRTFAEESKGAFVLICEAGMTETLNSEGKLFNYAAQGGYNNIRYSVNGRMLNIVEAVLFDEPYAVVENAAQFTAAIERFAEEKQPSFYIVREQEFRKELAEDAFSEEIMLASSKLDEYKGTSTSSGIFHYTDVVYAQVPQMICYTEDDVASAIRQMGAQGAAEFRLYLVGDLIETLSDKSFRRLHELEASSGMSSAKMSYSSSTTLRELFYTEAKIVADAVVLPDVSKAASFIEKRIHKGLQEITLFCSYELFDKLVGPLEDEEAAEDSLVPIYDLTAQAGIYDYELIISRDFHAVTINIKSLYPGTEIVLAVQNGTDNELSSALKGCLGSALKMASECEDEDALTTARNIHDALCRRITYSTEEGKTDRDTAVGALLDGRADCDGYSDAFYLVGTLAGLNIRYQRGEAVDAEFYDKAGTAMHMWNLIELEESWRLVDVTWDDAGDEIVYTWFNIGAGEASKTHRWNEEMTVKLAK